MIVIGTVIGARLGHVFFYEWPHYQDNWVDIFKVWEGGLASHGGGIGVLVAIYLHYRWNKANFPKMTFFGLLDMLVIPISFAFGCIRLGNFMNQEILGNPTTLPWGIIFLTPLMEAFHSPVIPLSSMKQALISPYFVCFGFSGKKGETLFLSDF